MLALTASPAGRVLQQPQQRQRQQHRVQTDAARRTLRDVSKLSARPSG